MPCSIEYDAEHALIHVVFSGFVTLADGQEADKKIRAVAPEDTPLRLLLEFNGVASEDSMVDLYWKARQWDISHEVYRRRTAILVADQAEITKKLDFFVTTCLNHGWQMQIFTDRQHAFDWLTR